MYFDTRVDPGKHQDSILLEVVWPEMKSVWELVRGREQYQKLFNQPGKQVITIRHNKFSLFYIG